MKKLKNFTNELKLEILFFIVVFITLIFRLTRGEYNKIFPLLLIIFTIPFLKFVLLKLNVRFSSRLNYTILGFMFLAMYLGKACNFYGLFRGWDKFLHLTSGVILTIIGYSVLLNLIKKDGLREVSPKISVIFAIIFSIASAGIWEIFEFSTDMLFNLTAQNGSLVDTMCDIICGSIGALFSGSLMYLCLKGVKIPILSKSLEKEASEKIE